MNREITIAGGGLAGLSLAAALRPRGVPVTVLEAANYPRHRVCGEFISGVSRETLDALGIAGLLADARRLESLDWHEGGRPIFRGRLKTPALGISRHRLDERLRRHAESLGCVVKTGVRVQPEAREGLVWAAGKRPCHGAWIGLKIHVRYPPKTADLEMHLGNNGYAGLADVEDGWTNVCGLFRIDRSLKAAGADLLAAYLEAGGNHRLAATLRSCEWRDGSFAAVAGFGLGRQPSEAGLLCLGDAESMIPPFTGNGMSMAFQAAECAVVPLTAWSRGERSWQDAVSSIRASLRRKFRRRISAAAALHALLLAKSGRALLRTLASARILPFQPMLALVR